MYTYVCIWGSLNSSNHVGRCGLHLGLLFWGNSLPPYTKLVDQLAGEASTSASLGDGTQVGFDLFPDRFSSHPGIGVLSPSIPKLMISSEILGLEAAQENHAKDQDSEELLRLMRTRRWVTFSLNKDIFVSCFFIISKPSSHISSKPSMNSWNVLIFVGSVLTWNHLPSIFEKAIAIKMSSYPIPLYQFVNRYWL